MKKTFAILLAIVILSSFCQIVFAEEADLLEIPDTALVSDETEDGDIFTYAELSSVVESAERGEAEYDGYIVKFADTPVMLMDSTSTISHVYDNIYKVDTVKDAEDCVKTGRVLYVEPNYEAYLCEEDEAQLYETFSYYNNWAYYAMNTGAALNYGLTGQGVKVGIIDTGTNLDDLNPENVVRKGILDPYIINDGKGHGTVVAGLIAGIHDNYIGVDGIAPDATIYAYKAFDDNGRNGTTDVIAKAIKEAIKDKVDIINMSLGVPNDNNTLKDAIDEAVAAGIIIIAAAGNGDEHGNPLCTPCYPAAYGNVIGVGALNYTSQSDPLAGYTIASYSNYNTETVKNVSITAPGSAVYEGGSGTSYACPCVAAAAALMLQKSDDISPNGMMELFTENAIDMGEPGEDVIYGYGRLSLEAVIPKISSLSGNPRPQNTEYFELEEPDFSDLNISAEYSDGTTGKIKSAKWEYIDSDTMRVTPTGSDKSIDFNISKIALSSLEVEFHPGTTVFSINDLSLYDGTGGDKDFILSKLFPYITVKAKSNESSRTVELHWDRYNTLGTIGKDEYRLSVASGFAQEAKKYNVYVRSGYNKDVMKTFEISFVDDYVKELIIDTAPTKTNYSEGDFFDTTGMTVLADYFVKGKTAITNYTVTPSRTLLATDTKVTVSYTDENGISVSKDIPISVTKASSCDIIINYEYADGTKAAESYSGEFAIGAPYLIVSPEVIGCTPSNVSISGTALAEYAGRKEYTVVYTKNKYKITVNYKYASGVMAGAPYETTYDYGESYKIKAPEITGYSAEPRYFKGTVPANNSELTFVFTKVDRVLVPDTINYTLTEGESINIPVTVNRILASAPNNSVLIAESSDTDVVGVSEMSATAVAPGKCTVRIYCEDKPAVYTEIYVTVFPESTIDTLKSLLKLNYFSFFDVKAPHFRPRNLSGN